MVRLASVAVPVPHLNLLTYRVPAELDMPEPGARVLVPLGTRTLTGCVVSTATVGDDDERGRGGAVRDIIDLFDDEPYLPKPVVDLALWTAEYYACAPGEAIAAAVPSLAWIESRRVIALTAEGEARVSGAGPSDLSDMQASALRLLDRERGLPVSTLRSRLGRSVAPQHRVPVASVIRSLERAGLVRVTQVLEGERTAYKTQRVVQLTALGREIAALSTDPAAVSGLGPRQRELLSALVAAPLGLSTADLHARKLPVDGLRRLAIRGLVTVQRQVVERDPFDGPWGRTITPLADAGPAPELSVEQSAALERLWGESGSRSYRVALVHGVTGSGKTELYLRLAERTRETRRRSIVMVPEIALTPAVVSAFRSRFGDRVAIHHSGLSDGERHDQWQRVRRGDVDVVVGTRSAIFSPLQDVGLIVVDEEHDASYKQDESPRYNGRDLAVVRGKQANALVILGSATPSLESYLHARNGRYELIALENRVLSRPMASVRTIDMRQEYADRGPDVILSTALTEAIGLRLDRREQVLLLLNRRGFATTVLCRQCGSTLECPNCSVSLVVHGRHMASCHYCNYGRRVPETCPACGGPYLEHMGFGTERVEAEVRAAFPQARVARLDRDAVRRRGALPELLGRFASGDIDIMAGTQMIAKGHDFPRVTLVGVVSADVGLGLADFRASERTFQLLTQVVGRAGRGDLRGEAIVQTLHPAHYSIRHAGVQDFSAFFAEELRFRKAMRYPPVVALINVVVRGPSQGGAIQAAADLVARVGRLAKSPTSFTVLGPAQAPLSRLKGEYRAQFFVKGAPGMRKSMREAVVTALAERPDLRRKVTIDVDPLSVL
ncbi:MAG: primosomal protein N' [Acidobacteriota bacterium]